VYLQRGVELELLNPELLSFDVARLQAAIKPERSAQFTYLGLQTLYDRYFLHSNDVRFELPQLFFMRVAMGLAIQEDDREARAIQFYDLLSSFDYMASTPTLFNAGTLRPQLSSCYLTTVPDDLYGIYGAIQDNAMLSKWAGGLGNDWTPVRALGSYIKGTNGKSQGVVPFLKVANDTAVAVNQGGKRKGAVCAYLETWHLDIEEFLELRKNTGDDRRRTHDMNTANWVPDLFMQRVIEDGEWTLFSPSDTPDLHDLTGNAFAARYAEYEQMCLDGQMRLFKKIKAQDLWRKMLSMLFETGHPWITFKDSCNLRSPQQHVGVVHSSNLCTEITLNTSADEIAVCNLGSINLVEHITDGKLNTEKLQKTVQTAVRMLDNVIDINYYAVPQAKNSNLKHRPVGLGIMGFQDALYAMDIAYGSSDAVAFADRSMEVISYHAIHTSTELAVERGAYSTFKGSLWDQGILPLDSLDIVAKNRPKQMLDVDRSSSMDWDSLRAKVQQDGMRNSNVMAIAPTATISNICGVSQSIEPTFQNLYVKSNLSGEFTVINPYLVRALKARGLWDVVMVNDLKHYEGSVQKISRIPDDLKATFATAFEVEPRWLVDAASRRQKWIDQAQSLNLYIAGANGKKLDITYKMAWLRGLKTTYYLRALGATSAEKSTITTGALNAVSAQTAPVAAAPTAAVEDDAAFANAAPVPLACSIDNPDCEACQ
jgi:ribonucleoside-diphosphate reductase alpha chain